MGVYMAYIYEYYQRLGYRLLLNRPNSIHNSLWSSCYNIYTQVDTLYLDMEDNFINAVPFINLHCIEMYFFIASGIS